MRITTDGYEYQVVNMHNPNLMQTICFIHKALDKDNKLVIIKDGTTNEEILKVMINRLQYLDKLVPDAHNTISITLLKSVLEHMKQRTRERQEQGIEGTAIQTTQDWNREKKV